MANNIYRFRDIMFKEPYAPYYDNYKGHIFKIDPTKPHPQTSGHIWLLCIDDPSVMLQGFVELIDLERVL